ncbi:MAG TPA: glycine/betaine ABC transporter substrate-binding protein, partial [Arthrobacter bacterium]|nr:glycine/betaine ABC transporter substrate-binding protein [Arthrobacter sp.]
MKDNVRTPLTRRGLAGLAAGVGLAVALTACGGSNPLSTPSTSAATGGTSGGSLTVGSADFPESQIIAEIYAGALNAAGVTATTKPNIGSREIYFK